MNTAPEAAFLNLYGGMRNHGLHHVFIRPEYARRLPEAPAEAWPQSGILAGSRIDVPALATARGPDRAAQASLNADVVAGFDLRFYIDRSDTVIAHIRESLHDVRHLRLDHEDHRVMGKR